MKISSADKNYEDAVWYVLNRIKGKLLFDPENKRVVDYMLNLNIKAFTVPGFIEERNVIQQLKNKKIISQVGEVDIVEFGEEGTPEYEAYELYHFKVTDSFDEYYEKFQVMQDIDGGRWCWFDGNTFFIKLKDGTPKPIAFDTERGKLQMLALFTVLIEHWKRRGEEHISRGKIISEMKRRRATFRDDQLKNIFSNIRKTKIRPAGLDEVIKITYDKKFDGWKIEIKR